MAFATGVEQSVLLLCKQLLELKSRAPPGHFAQLARATGSTIIINILLQDAAYKLIRRIHAVLALLCEKRNMIIKEEGSAHKHGELKRKLLASPHSELPAGTRTMVCVS